MGWQAGLQRRKARAWERMDIVNEDFGGKDGSVVVGGAHQILKTREGMASRTAEENKGDCADGRSAV